MSSSDEGPDAARCTCPGHRDRKPSLSLKWTGDKVLLRCHAGCASQDLLRAVGLRMADLFSPAVRAPQRRRTVATYRYRDPTGLAIAEKVRFDPKGFAWRAISPSSAGSRWGLRGVGLLPLYRLPELLGVRQVIVVEGEKAVDRLRALGVVATCPPAGASSWPDCHTAALAEAGVAEVVVLPDADRPGIRHAERVAASVCSHTGVTRMSAKVVTLPNLPPSGDVVDWLDSGREVSELRRLVQETPVWFPGRTRESGPSAREG